ncbi:uncharacterized protein B0I36DRAFT_377429 [Microdochium trichocladiopsis]|uniref:Uncharacterized protein n=1 Tax=Microdochium trichocladiopsis TaxID=1682393 RepID=A0A9P8XTW3_9PEZI|nr:uncharacterized protein B0I36DRAFT_377429 [Microdochium trichocladiopsis]KAH7018039.1 hypothetical protein B0I36DRAFT_377429 [Microdochium trichocladiopsis]
MAPSAAPILASVAFLVGSAQAVCASGEVGISRVQVYNYNGANNVLESDSWDIVANNCNTIATGKSPFKGNPCSASPYPNGYGVSGCDSSGKPGSVKTTGGNFGNCYSHGARCANGPYFYSGVFWCCKRV